MPNEIINILKERPITIPRILLTNYSKLNLTEEELVIIIYLINISDKIPYNPTNFAKELNMDKYKVMQIINNLTEKNILTIKVEISNNNLSEEYIYLDLLYNKLFTLILDTTQQTKKLSTDLFSLFETELGRPLSPMECEIIKEWTTSNYTEELIREALKEAIYNNVRNLKYVDRILYTWQTKGIKNKEDVLKDKQNRHKQTKKVTNVFDYNWLEEDD